MSGPSVSHDLACGLRVLDQERKRDHAKDHDPEHPEIIDVGQHGRLLDHIRLHQRIGMLLRRAASGARPSAAARESIRHPVQRRLKLRISGVQFLRQPHLVKLGAARQAGGDKRNPEAAANISGEVHQAGSGIVLLAWQRGIGGDVNRHEQTRQSDRLVDARHDHGMEIHAQVEGGHME